MRKVFVSIGLTYDTLGTTETCGDNNAVNNPITQTFKSPVNGFSSLEPTDTTVSLIK